MILSKYLLLYFNQAQKSLKDIFIYFITFLLVRNLSSILNDKEEIEKN